MKIEDFVKVNEINVSKSYPYKTIEYIDTSSTENGRITETQVLSLKDAPSRAKRIVRKNDILISTVRPNLKHHAIAKEPKPNTVASTGYAVISCKKINPYYLYYFLTTENYTEYLAAIAESQQSNFPAFNPSLIEKTKIVPPKPEVQFKIAAILSAYDDLIENNNKRITILEKMAEEIYKEWFVRMRFPATADKPGYKNTKFVKGIPEGWNKIPIEKLCDEIRKGIKRKNIKPDARYIGLEHIPQKTIALKSFANIDTVDSDKLTFEKYDILFTKIRPYLHKVVLLHFSGVCSSDTIVIRAKAKIYEAFILFTVFSDTFIELATISSKGTKMPRADWDYLKKLEVILPTESLLEKYQLEFGYMFDQITNLLNQNESIIKTRDLLLPRLLSGKLSVENLDIKYPPSMENENA